jgi:hypothetical protein
MVLGYGIGLPFMKADLPQNGSKIALKVPYLISS